MILSPSYSSPIGEWGGSLGGEQDLLVGDLSKLLSLEPFLHVTMAQYVYMMLVLLSTVYLHGQSEPITVTATSEMYPDQSEQHPLNRAYPPTYDLRDCDGHASMYPYIRIYGDDSGDLTIGSILEAEYLLEDSSFDVLGQSSTYWARLTIVPDEEQPVSEHMLHISTNNWDVSWESIEAWIIRGDTISEHVIVRGDQEEDEIGSCFDLLPLSGGDDTPMEIVMRLSGPRGHEEGDLINFWLLDRARYPGLERGYAFTGSFQTNQNSPYRYNLISTAEYWIDGSDTATIRSVDRRWDGLDRGDMHTTRHLPNMTYWMKLVLYGSDDFYGDHLFHISSRPRWAGYDTYSFDQLDTYVADGSGDQNAIDALQESRNRLESMGLIHHRLYTQDKGLMVNMVSYCDELCRYLESSFSRANKQILINDDVRYGLMDVDYAIPLGLIINELVTNSVKYAFDNQQHGLISLILKESNDHLSLEVSDDGSGWAGDTSHHKSTSFGTELVKTLCRKMKGEITISTDRGYSTLIKFSRYQ